MNMPLKNYLQDQRCFSIYFILFALLPLCSGQTALAQSQWWKGNLHTHSLWSDGDDFPEMIVNWYKEHGYDFLALSDHNVMLTGDKWVSISTNNTTMIALEK